VCVCVYSKLAYSAVMDIWYDFVEEGFDYEILQGMRERGSRKRLRKSSTEPAHYLEECGEDV
jgi:hypothetical protein